MMLEKAQVLKRIYSQMSCVIKFKNHFSSTNLCQKQLITIISLYFT